jgi:hypothetical protein
VTNPTRGVRIQCAASQRDRVLVFLTNHLELAATIAAIYKERWQTELFFRALKQSLRVKTFVGTSANALKTRLWAALIAMLLVKYLQLKAKFGWSLSEGPMDCCAAASPKANAIVSAVKLQKHARKELLWASFDAGRRAHGAPLRRETNS